MTPEYAARLDRTVRRVCAPLLRDFFAGKLDTMTMDGVVVLEQRVQRQANAIRAAFREGPPPTSIACTDCQADVPYGRPAVNAGKPYCAGCAPRHRLTPPPRFSP